MKKIATLFFFCLVSLNLLNAQTSGGPDVYGYTWKNNFAVGGPVYNWIDIVPLTGSQNVRFLSDDNIVGSFPVGFPFHYYWYDVTQFWVGSNGYIGFTNGTLASGFPNIPLASGTNNYIAAMASDLYFNAPAVSGFPLDTAECWRWSNAAQDTLIISFINVPFYQMTLPNYTGNNTFQIILSAVDSSITFQYKEQVGATALPAAGNGVTVGIENNSGNIGLMPMVNTLPSAGMAIKFYYPASTTYQVSDASTVSNNNPETGGVFISKNTPTPFVMSTSVKNTGNQNLPAFNVFSRVMDNLGGIQVQQTMMSNALTPGQTQTINMTTPWNPTTQGLYTYQSSTQYIGDITPSNNSKIQELHVVDTTTANVRLSFDSGINGVIGGLSWSGGNGGAGYYFIPPFYPCLLTQLHSYIETDPNAVGFSMMVYDDNGVANTPGSLLDSVTMAAGTTIPASWNTLTTTNPIQINSGGVYVAWSMNGLGVALGEDSIAPFSNRTFEVVNGTWATYRARESLDFMINVTIAKVPGQGVNEVTMNDYFGQFSPNPSTSYSVLNFDLPADVNSLSYEMYDVQGKMVESRNLNNQVHSGKLSINSESLNAGLYTCKINVDGNKVMRKLVVMK